MRSRPIAGDSALALLLLFLEVVLSAHARSPFWFFLVTALLVVPMVVRRTATVPAAYVVLAGYALSIVTFGNTVRLAADIAVAVFLYTLVSRHGRIGGASYVAALLVLYPAKLILHTPEQARGAIPVGVAMGILFFAVCWVLGEFVGARRAHHEAVEQRLRAVEFERDQQARIAVAEERNRIARELHDVLAHSVSVMVTQADGATYSLRKKPELAEQAMTTIGDTGRAALAELRHLLAVLRNSEEPGESRSPQPNAAGVRELADRVRSLGLPVTVEVDGELDDLPTGLGLSIYRIVQESLTNALRHAGRAASASVIVRNDGHRIDVQVLDDGTRRAAEDGSGGHGLIGMRERATVYGGTLEAGPADEGGWRVHAVLPLDGVRVASG
ncbi:sensor histidine kinase [Allosaccharopolyspora coralli]|uniref:histidine kinase n=1 Tax=Allosaccharopolyspora coralli TaxID=2665642 RepID=A0A5Q3QGX5_9PSEU|nr:sensor histidine kinase [Allosaccharopolyspora coralli]